jgi:DNA-binding beta-propeller fold protein YncE
MTTAGEQLLVADSTGGRVIRVTGGGQILQEWTVGGEPRALVAGRPGVLWLSDPNGHRVIRLDTSSGARDPFPTGGAPGELAVDPAEKLWVTDSTDSHVLRIGRKTGQDPLSSHPVGVGHGPVAIAIADGVIWVANAGDGSVTRLSYRAPWHRLGPDTHIGGDLGGIAASGTKAWVTDTRNGTVTQLESSSQ